jgi:hypothetical protein
MNLPLYCVIPRRNVPMSCYRIHGLPPPILEPADSLRFLVPSRHSQAFRAGKRLAIFSAMNTSSAWSSSHIRLKWSRTFANRLSPFFPPRRPLSFLVVSLAVRIISPCPWFSANNRCRGISRASEIFSRVSSVGIARPFSSHESRQRGNPQRRSRSAWDRFRAFRSSLNRAPISIRMMSTNEFPQRSLS